MTMMTSHYRSLIQAQMQLVDLLPDKTAATDSTGEGTLCCSLIDLSFSAHWLHFECFPENLHREMLFVVLGCCVSWQVGMTSLNEAVY